MANLKYVENKQITSDNYDKSLAVKCINGIFVGKKTDNVIAYKGIPFVGKQPVGELRWKTPTDFVEDSGVYEAYHYGKAPVQTPGDIAAEYGIGEDCLYLNIWKADDDIKNKPVMVWIYGGDPDNVTIWGESAGAASCTLLPLIKGSHKYFKRVIAQSGTPTQTRSSEQAIACTNEVMEALDCKTVADLLNVSAEKFTDTWAKLFGFYQVLGIRTFPERDGKYLPLNPWQAYAEGAAKDLDFLQGCNRDEMNTFLGVLGVDSWNAWAPNRKAEKLSQLNDAEKLLVESYCNDVQGNDPDCSLIGQILFIAPQIRLSEEHTKSGGKSYTYYFTAESTLPLIKSGHAIELATVFNHPDQPDLAGRAFDENFSKTMRKMWIQFAKTGNPSLDANISPDGKPKDWTPYDTENKKVMVFDEFNIHQENEAALKIVDWDRTYFLTNYYSI